MLEIAIASFLRIFLIFFICSIDPHPPQKINGVWIFSFSRKLNKSISKPFLVPSLSIDVTKISPHLNCCIFFNQSFRFMPVSSLPL